MYTKESLERLKEKIDLIELITSHIDLKPAGSTYKGCCPFHDEKTPSFTVKRGDTHYHCFGCGAHGDAIQFMMVHLQLTFQEAVLSLAERFQVVLEVAHQKGGEDLGPLKEALELAHQYYHYCLVETESGTQARDYLLQRGLTLDFINRFALGFSPEDESGFRRVMRRHHFSDEILLKAGLLSKRGGDFFRGRILFPIRTALGQIVGFSARKIREEDFGGKYINTPETALFKKSHLLFGLHYSRRRIAKEGIVIVVEGQIDALRLIDAGLHYVVAALGTAFGKEHVAQLKKLGVKKSYLLFDGDKAGRSAASKVGDLFQEVGIDVMVASLPEGSDPDSYLRSHSIEELCRHLEQGKGYLAFQIDFLGLGTSPAEKSQCLKKMQAQIERWEDPVMVHESFKKIAKLMDLPEHMVAPSKPIVTIPQNQKIERKRGDLTHILEMDLLRWLILKSNENPSFMKTALCYLQKEHFFHPTCRALFSHFVEKKEVDLLSCMIEGGDEKIQGLLDEIMARKVNIERAERQFLETVQKLCDRFWLQQSEAIRLQMDQSGQSEEMLFSLLKQFDALKKQRPSVTLIE